MDFLFLELDFRIIEPRQAKSAIPVCCVLNTWDEQKIVAISDVKKVENFNRILIDPNILLKQFF